MQLKINLNLYLDRIPNQLISENVYLKTGGFMWINKKCEHRDTPVFFFAEEKLH